MNINFDIRLIDIVILIGIIVIICFFGCGNKKQDFGQILSKTDTLYLSDTTTKHISQVNSEIYSYKTDSIIYVPELNQDELRKAFSELFKEYFAKYFYSDTINKDSIIVIINDTLTRNSISHRDISLRNLRQSKIITNNFTEPEQPKNKLYLGAFLTYWKTASGGGLLTFQNKKEQMITLGYGINKSFVAGFQTKIHFKN